MKGKVGFGVRVCGRGVAEVFLLLGEEWVGSVRKFCRSSEV